ncbi:MAG: NUDIX domain-containing protein [Candidatus Eisenbacteria bacterium]|uniref:NUDIX domain-containing protein n=1 Tax=Eiseniibacteriota bacterium TaxID=2212470 RepID=A0A538SD49_UNCEI|nr:MAG: NUDIX domain-containing protein [Candidatus Eisenbacteria bacterium]
MRALRAADPPRGGRSRARTPAHATLPALPLSHVRLPAPLRGRGRGEGSRRARAAPRARAARRELREETGLTVGAMEWLGFYWDRYYLEGFGFFPTMNFYFLARWRSGVPRAGDDAAEAEWVPAARLGGPGQKLAWKHMREVFRDVRRRLRMRS